MAKTLKDYLGSANKAKQVKLANQANLGKEYKQSEGRLEREILLALMSYAQRLLDQETKPSTLGLAADISPAEQMKLVQQRRQNLNSSSVGAEIQVGCLSLSLQLCPFSLEICPFPFPLYFPFHFHVSITFFQKCPLRLKPQRRPQLE
jgi:hypothetical protein